MVLIKDSEHVIISSEISLNQSRIEFLEKWNDVVDEIMKNGVIWVERNLMWKKFCQLNEIKAKKPDVISNLDLMKLDRLSDGDLYRELLKSCCSAILDVI